MFRRFVLTLLVMIAASSFPTKSSQACFCVACDCASATALHETTIVTINTAVYTAFRTLIEVWIEGWLLNQHWYPALDGFSKQVTLSSQKANLELRSTLVTARQQAAAQRTIQEHKYDAAEEVQVYEETCEVITLSQSLVASDGKSKAATEVMTNQSMARLQGASGSMSATGPDEDRLSRFAFASQRYFSPEEMGGAVEDYALAPNDKRLAKDVMTHTLLEKGTLNIDSSDGVLTPDEEDIFALKTNLYNNETLTRLTRAELADYSSYDELDDLQSLSALKAMAQYSFDAIVGLKVAGDTTSAASMQALLSDLGMSADGIEYVMGDSSRPSYLQQLKILSQTIQSTPEAQIDEIGGKAESLRRLAIREAIELMVKFEIYRSYQRATVMTAGLHEVKRRELQDAWEAHPLMTRGLQ